MKKIQLLFSLVVLSVLFSCASKKNALTEGNPEDDKNTTGMSYLISAPIVEKQRIILSETQEETDFFLERSVQDYFIKFCESAVSRAELESNLKSQRASIKILHAEIEYREGEWDTCDDSNKALSRTGAYIVIKRLLK